MFANYAKQIYSKLIKQEYNPFANNIEENVTNQTMMLGLIKVTQDIVYIVNILNAFVYEPDILIGKSMLERENFTKKYPNITIKSINIFLANDDTLCKEYINNIDSNLLQQLDHIYWSVSTNDDDSLSIFSSPHQPNKLMGIEKIISKVKSDTEDSNEVSLKHITAKAIYESPLRVKFSIFQFYNILIFVNVLVFLIMATGSGFSTESLLGFGAFSYDRIVNYHEYYRLFTCMFLHGSLGHLVANMLTLYIFGRVLELTTSHVNFLATYFLSGLSANVVMLLFPSNAVMVGASGCIFGLIGATLVLTFYFKRTIFGLNFSAIFSIALINIFYSIVVPEISLAVHTFGLIFGMLIGFVYALDIKEK